MRSRPAKPLVPELVAQARSTCAARPRKPCFTAHARGGFSLVELLVVLAVAMLLTALTLPAMRQVHENAQRVACMANLQQLGHAFIMYGDDHNDTLPPSQAQMNSETPQNLMMSRRVGPPGWEGLGILYAQHYCDVAECFYCPSHHGSHPYDRYARQWDAAWLSQPIFANYHYAGHMDWTNPSRRRTMLDGYKLVLATDGLRTANDFNHIQGMNVLRGDGSVRWRDDNDDILGILPRTEVEQISPQYMSLWDILGEGR